VPTIMTRTDDTFITLEARAKFTETYPDYIFVSIHYNQGIETSHGVETFRLTPRYAPSTNAGGQSEAGDTQSQVGNKNDQLNLLLSSLIHRQVVTLHSLEGDRGLKQARFVVLRRALNPSVLVECGFLSHRSGDMLKIGTKEYRQSIAEKISDGIIRYMEFMQAPEPPKSLLFGVNFQDVRPEIALRDRKTKEQKIEKNSKSLLLTDIPQEELMNEALNELGVRPFSDEAEPQDGGEINGDMKTAHNVDVTSILQPPESKP
jgi:hypothetical protein